MCYRVVEMFLQQLWVRAQQYFTALKCRHSIHVKGATRRVDHKLGGIGVRDAVALECSLSLVMLHNDLSSVPKALVNQLGRSSFASCVGKAHGILPCTLHKGVYMHASV